MSRGCSKLLAALLLLPLLPVGCGAPTVAHYMKPARPPRGSSPEENLRDARAAWNILAERDRRGDWAAARASYNRAVALAFEDLRRSDSDWNKAAAENGSTWKIAPPLARDPYQLGEVFPAARVPVGPLGRRATTDGIGLPVVSWIDEGAPLYQNFDRPPPTGMTTMATAVLRFDRGTIPTWELVNPSLTESIFMKGVPQPLAMDLSAAHALYWRMSQLDKHKLGEVLRPDRRNSATRLYFAQAPHPDRIPLVLVHGFNSSPDAFAPMLVELLAEPWFRDRYQVWVFNYSTGVPWMLSAARFRQQFRAAVQQARRAGVRHVDQCVIVGHSMGGLITHASLKDPGTEMYANFSRKPPDQLNLRPDERKKVEEVFQWKPLKEVKRVVFIATPHRGSPMADTFYSAFGSWLISLPEALTDGLTDLVQRNTAEVSDPLSADILDHLFFRRGDGLRAPTVIESLSPKRPTIRTLQTIVFPKRVTLHSVIGDRGRGETIGGSDGVVPYSSSHLIEAASECIVPTNHAAVEHPGTIREVKRILEIHLRNVSP